MQDQPPGPPPGYQPPPAAGGSSGIDKKTGAILSYVLGWVTGLVFLFVGKDDPDVKYHAAQSVVFFGALAALDIVLEVVSAVMPWMIGAVLYLVVAATGVFGFVIWIMSLIQANNTGGQKFALPLVGGVVSPYAEKLAAAIK